MRTIITSDDGNESIELFVEERNSETEFLEGATIRFIELDNGQYPGKDEKFFLNRNVMAVLHAQLGAILGK